MGPWVMCPYLCIPSCHLARAGSMESSLHSFTRVMGSRREVYYSSSSSYRLLRLGRVKKKTRRGEGVTTDAIIAIASRDAAASSIIVT